MANAKDMWRFITSGDNAQLLALPVAMAIFAAALWSIEPASAADEMGQWAVGGEGVGVTIFTGLLTWVELSGRWKEFKRQS